MLARVSRRLPLVTPALLAGLLWMGLPGVAEAGDWKHGRRHGHREHGYSSHYEHSRGYKHYEHRGKRHHEHRAYSHGGGYRHHGKWHGDHRRNHHHHHHSSHYYPAYYPAPVAVSVYLDAPCGHSYDSWDAFSHHVHHHHGVAFVDLPGLLVQTHSGFVFHR
jgi:hypothetical protein